MHARHLKRPNFPWQKPKSNNHRMQTVTEKSKRISNYFTTRGKLYNLEPPSSVCRDSVVPNVNLFFFLTAEKNLPFTRQRPRVLRHFHTSQSARSPTCHLTNSYVKMFENYVRFLTNYTSLYSATTSD